MIKNHSEFGTKYENFRLCVTYISNHWSNKLGTYRFHPIRLGSFPFWRHESYLKNHLCLSWNQRFICYHLLWQNWKQPLRLSLYLRNITHKKEYRNINVFKSFTKRYSFCILSFHVILLSRIMQKMIHLIIQII